MYVALVTLSVRVLLMSLGAVVRPRSKKV
jgi:hypothetical protein